MKALVSAPYRLFAPRQSLLLALCAVCIPSTVLAQDVAVPPSRVAPGTIAPPRTQAPLPDLKIEPSANESPESAAALKLVLGSIAIDGGRPEMAQEVQRLTSSYVGREVSVAELYDLARQIEAAYGDRGYILTRASVPPQELKNGGNFRIKLIDGYIESIDYTHVPKFARGAVRRYLGPLVGKPGLTQRRLERRLLLAGNVPGVRLQSALARGFKPGGTRLLLEADWSPLSGVLSANNGLDDDYGTYQASAQLSLNNVLGAGESIYGTVTNGTDMEQLFRDRPVRRVAGLGALVPIGGNGLSVNPEYLLVNTEPKTRTGQLASRGRFERASIRLAYPVIKNRRESLNASLGFELVNEYQRATRFNLLLHKDRLRVLTAALDWQRQLRSGINLGAQVNFAHGLDVLGARNLQDAARERIPLSRQGTDADFSKIQLNTEISLNIRDNMLIKTEIHGQKSLSGALPSYGQFGLDGQEALSSFRTGGLNVDNGLTVRTEVSRPVRFKVGPVIASLQPFLYGAVGVGTLAKPTRQEKGDISGASYGVGVRSLWGIRERQSTLSVNLEYGRGDSNIAQSQHDRLFFAVSLRF